MVGMKYCGILCVIPALLLLTLGFFVAVVLAKVKDKGLQSFGRIVVVLLCAAAFLMFATGMFVVGTGNCPVVNKIGKCSIDKGAGMPFKHHSMYKTKCMKYK